MTRPTGDTPRAAGGEPEKVGATKPVIDALTGIRALALIWVLATHLGEAAYQLFPSLRVLAPVLHNGHLAVDTFFVLSGFIISYNYAGALSRLDQRGYRDFMRARLARIYPTYLFGLLAMALVVLVAARMGTTAHAGQDYTIPGFVGNALLLQAVPGVTPWNWPTWSVGTEFFAYLVFPFVAFAVYRARRRTAIVVAVLVLAAAMAVLWVPMDAASYNVVLMWARIAGGFTVGCLMWAVWRHGIRRHWRWDVVALVALVLVVGLAAVAPIPPMPWAALPLIAVFVLAVASCASGMARFLGSRPMEWLGRRSYSIYVVHSPVLSGIWLFYPPALFAGASFTTRVGVVASWTAAMLVAGVLTYRLVEEPGRRALRRRHRPPASTPPSTPSTPTAPAAASPSDR